LVCDDCNRRQRLSMMTMWLQCLAKGFWPLLAIATSRQK
jgi:hypothetical protein